MDHNNRLAALDPTQSVCVSAPAGSGKTELLSQRVLRLLANCDQPENVLAITFTRKAAAEMRHRIIAAIRLASSEPIPEEGHKQLTWKLAKAVLARDEVCGWQLLLNPNRLQIQTIDSLSASLSRKMPIVASFGTQPQITDTPENCYRQAVQGLFEQLESSSPLADDIARLLLHLDNDMQKAERLLVSLLSRRDQWLANIFIPGSEHSIREQLEVTLNAMIEETLSLTRNALSPYSGELIPLLDYAGNQLPMDDESLIKQLTGIVELPPADATAIVLWLAIADTLLTAKNGWRKTLTKKQGFPTETNEGDKKQAKANKNTMLSLITLFTEDESLLECLSQLRSLPPSALYSDSQWQLLEVLSRLLPRLVAELTLVFQQSGEVDYSQVSMAALQALGDGLNPTELMLRLDHKLNHILVDEFQDTSSTQYQLLSRLIEGWQEYNEANPENPNTLFIVGDGMQSIYGFRQANVGLFLEARSIGINGLKLNDSPLSVNFRSDPCVVDWINNTFASAFPAKENLSRGAVPYAPSHAFNPANVSSDVSLYGFTGEQAREQEADKVLELVQQRLRDNPEGYIAILVRSRAHLKDILPRLIAAKLPWNSSEIEPLYHYSPVKDLLTLTKALLNLNDQLAWTALLRTPWLGLDNTDLHTLLTAPTSRFIGSSILNGEQVPGLSRYAREKIDQLTSVVSEAFKRRQRLSLRLWIESVWLALGGASCLGDMSEFDYIDDYFDLLESQQQAGVISSFTDFEKILKARYAMVSDPSSKIHLMTIHKAKGLEFDTVILPALGRSQRSDDKALLMWREYISPTGETGLIMSPLSATGEEDDPIYQYLRSENNYAARYENSRLLYVAATRAISHLYLLLTSDLDKDDEIKAPVKNSLIYSIWPAVNESIDWQHQQLASIEQIDFSFDATNDSGEMQRISSQWQSPSWRFSNPLEEFYFSEEGGGGQIIEHSDSTAQCVGTVCHLILEVLAKSGPDRWEKLTDEHRRRWLISLLNHYQLAIEFHEQAVNDICHAINNTLSDKYGRWCLSSAHAFSTTEMPLTRCSSEQIRNRIIDRVFKDEEGVYWIIDYKTGRPRQDESRDDFIARECDAYTPQLHDYQQLVQQLMSRNESDIRIKAGLYFTYYPHWQEIIF
jgi:ATP-dependent exoDNAse (exonuclease V) beta subunit